MDQVIKDEATGGSEDPFLRLSCYEPWYHLVIKTDGKVGPCCIFDSADADNIKEKDLSEVWFGSYLQKIRDMLREGKLQGFCAICNAGQVAQNRWLREQLRTVIANHGE